MFGLEKGKKRVFMEFDLEKELKQDPKKAKERLSDVQSKIANLKTELRKGSKSKELEQLGLLLHGYTALQRVLTRVGKS